MCKMNFAHPTRLSKSYWAQNREMMLKVLIHNIVVILFVEEPFYRAFLTPLFFLPLDRKVMYNDSGCNCLLSDKDNHDATWACQS